MLSLLLDDISETYYVVACTFRFKRNIKDIRYTVRGLDSITVVQPSAGLDSMSFVFPAGYTARTRTTDTCTC